MAGFVEPWRDGCITPPQASTLPVALAFARAALARAAPLGSGRPGPGRLRGLLRLRLLPQLGRRRGRRSAGGRDSLLLRLGGLPGSRGAVRDGSAARGAPDDGGGAPPPDGGGLPGRRPDPRPGGRHARPGARGDRARRLPRRRLPARARRPGGGDAVLGVEHAVLEGRVTHPLRLPDARGHPPAHRRVDRRGGAGRPAGGHHHGRPGAPYRSVAQPADRGHAPGGSAAGRPDP